jgi:non-ribosomal peptide synthetase component F
MMTYAAYKKADVVDGRSLRSGFLRQAKDTPDRVALVVEGVSRTYAEIDDTARRWANALMNRLECRPERVGVFGYRTEVAYTATLACLYAGAAFVPLNKTFPLERTAVMAHEAKLDALIVDSTSLSQLPEVLSALDPIPLVMVPHAATLEGELAQYNAITRKDLASIEPARCLPPVMPDDLAYLLFTSGSTGKPKGVGVTHANILNLLDVMQCRLAITPEDRFSQTFAQTFDVSVFDLFMAWEHGASVYAMRQVDVLAPTRYINQNNLTVWFSVPSVITLMRRKNNLRPNSMPSLRYSLFAGEPLPRRSAESWLDAAPIDFHQSCLTDKPA